MKTILSTISASIMTAEAMSQPAEYAINSLVNDPLLPLYITAAAVVLLFIFVTVVTIYVIRVLNYLTRESERENALKCGLTYVRKESWWKRFVQKMNASVPLEKERDIELEHSYDGIRELDNHLPPWWRWLFNGSIAFAVVYMLVYHVTDSLPLSHDEYKHELAMAEEEMKKYQSSQPQVVIDENTIEYNADPAAIEKGKSVFMNSNCGGCHRGDGGGNTIGPNLADEYWLHGGEIRNIFQTIKNGVVEKGMPAWGKSMSAQDVRDVTFFVMSLQGTNPPDAKPPQGEIFRQVKISADTARTQAGL